MFIRTKEGDFVNEQAIDMIVECEGFYELLRAENRSSEHGSWVILGTVDDIWFFPVDPTEDKQ